MNLFQGQIDTQKVALANQEANMTAQMANQKANMMAEMARLTALFDEFVANRKIVCAIHVLHILPVPLLRSNRRVVLPLMLLLLRSNLSKMQL